MMNPDYIYRLKDMLAAGDLHRQRMNYALHKLKALFPLEPQKYNQLEAEQISFTDQLIFRFTKLQDLMGRKLFRLVLEGLGEETENVPFIDILNKLEKLNLIEDKDQWLELREIRNLLAHEYPLQQESYITDLNELYDHCGLLAEIWEKLKQYAIGRFALDRDADRETSGSNFKP